jgi:streptomycin 6-kinase
MIAVPEAFAHSTIQREGERGRAWVAGLPKLVDRLCEEWGLECDGDVLHGYVAVVVPVVRGGSRAMLKVSWIDASSEQEALALEAWDGQGAVRLLGRRAKAGALLLERLDPHRSLLDAGQEEAVDVAATLLRRLAIPAPSELRSAAVDLEEMEWTLPRQWEEHGRPFARSLLERALERIEGGLKTDRPAIVNHDLHYGNVLAAEREPWLVIDPKVYAGDPELGVAQLLWNRMDELDGRADLARRLDRIVEVAELDGPLTRAWTLVRLVDAWLWSLDQGMEDDAERYRTLIGWLMCENP